MLGTAPGDESDFSRSPRLAYNPAADEFLVTWIGYSAAAGVPEGDGEVLARRLDGLGRPVGAVIRVSEMGSATAPANWWTVDGLDVTYHSGRNEYLVVWDGSDERESRFDCEVYGQRLDAAGVPIGEDDFQISSMWPPEASNGCGPIDPRVVHQPANDEYLVVWWGRVPEPQRIDGVWAQRLGATGGLIGGPVLISDPTQRVGFTGDVVANGLDGEYLVAWNEDYPLDAIRGRRLDASLRRLGGELSIYAPPTYPLGRPVLSFDPWRRHYVATVIIGNPHDTADRRVFAVPLDVTGTAIAPAIQVSGDPQRNTAWPLDPAIASVPADGEHIVVWSGADPEPPLAPMLEIAARRLRDPATGTAPRAVADHEPARARRGADGTRRPAVPALARGRRGRLRAGEGPHAAATAAARADRRRRVHAPTGMPHPARHRDRRPPRRPADDDPGRRRQEPAPAALPAPARGPAPHRPSASQARPAGRHPDRHDDAPRPSLSDDERVVALDPAVREDEEVEPDCDHLAVLGDRLPVELDDVAESFGVVAPPEAEPLGADPVLVRARRASLYLLVSPCLEDRREGEPGSRGDLADLLRRLEDVPPVLGPERGDHPPAPVRIGLVPEREVLLRQLGRAPG